MASPVDRGNSRFRFPVAGQKPREDFNFSFLPFLSFKYQSSETGTGRSTNFPSARLFGSHGKLIGNSSQDPLVGKLVKGSSLLLSGEILFDK